MHPPSAACRLLLASCRFLHTTCCSLAASPSTARYQMFATCRPRSHTRHTAHVHAHAHAARPTLRVAQEASHAVRCTLPAGRKVQGAGAGRRCDRAAGIKNEPAHTQRSVRGRCKAAPWGVAGRRRRHGGGRAHTERNRTATALGIKTEPAHAQWSVRGRRKAVMQGGGAGRRRGALQGGGHRERACARSTERARVVQGGGVGQGSDVGHGRAAAASKTSPPGAFQGGGGTGASKTSPRTLNGACGVGAGRRRGAFQGSGHRERSHARSTERARAVQGGGMGQGNGVGHGSVRGWRHKYGGQKVYEKLALKQREHRKRQGGVVIVDEGDGLGGVCEPAYAQNGGIGRPGVGHGPNFLMPTPLAQELLDIIISHVHDKPTLKSCALASSRLHTLSQRGLFASFRISLVGPSQAPTTSYMAVNDRFLQSPQLAGYVTTLTVEFRSDSSAWTDISAFRSLLGRLKHVRYCNLDSEYSYVTTTWGTLFSAPILEFIRRQNLLELHIRSISRIPFATLAAFFCATQTLGLHDVRVKGTPEDLNAAFPDVKVECLHISKSISVYLAPLAASVRRMWFTVDPRILDLSYCSLNSDVDPPAVAMLKPLFGWTTVALTEIRMSYALGKRRFRKHYFHVGTLEAVAAALGKCPGAPRISWYLSVEGKSARKERELVNFTALLQARLPHLHEQGRLSVQNHIMPQPLNTSSLNFRLRPTLPADSPAGIYEKRPSGGKFEHSRMACWFRSWHIRRKPVAHVKPGTFPILYFIQLTYLVFHSRARAGRRNPRGVPAAPGVETQCTPAGDEAEPAHAHRSARGVRPGCGAGHQNSCGVVHGSGRCSGAAQGVAPGVEARMGVVHGGGRGGVRGQGAALDVETRAGVVHGGGRCSGAAQGAASVRGVRPGRGAGRRNPHGGGAQRRAVQRRGTGRGAGRRNLRGSAAGEGAQGGGSAGPGTSKASPRARAAAQHGALQGSGAGALLGVTGAGVEAALQRCSRCVESEPEPAFSGAGRRCRAAAAGPRASKRARGAGHCQAAL
ncbi:hypothetical protein GGX14DRAFT_392110 [Mycena pura]|uniref:F-box domain-containing protein n=1 Tax=Mycena pura TaxID=153505 RepID=A0AAD6YJA4_9AGAR|nr:hypothetical protein GGX14DRAFT_392110 [Mycena pura]